MRNAITVAPVKDQGASKYALYFGDIKANVYGVDATSGKLLWKVKVEDQPVARITGAPALYEGRLYVPVSSTEERAAGYSAVYPCCTFRGSVVALDANTGKQIWKTFIIPDAPKPLKKTSKGVQLWGPAGGAVWNTPTVDPKNHALYIGTGDAYNHPAGKTTDAIMAIEMSTGKALWAVQDTEEDAWLAGCEPQGTSENCPEDIGPDYDFGASPILRTLPNGRRILVAGQKSGIVWGHDPDKEGAVVWKAQLVEKLARGEITFGGAADGEKAYFGLKGGIAALQLSNGDKKWFTPIEAPKDPALRNGETAALTAIPGVVFSRWLGWSGARTFDRRRPRTLEVRHDARVQNGERRGGERRFHGRRRTDRSRRNAFRGLRLYVRPRRNRKCAAGIFAELEIRQFPETSSEQKRATLARHRDHAGPGMERRRVTARRGLSCRRGTAGDALWAPAPGRDDADSGKRLRIGGGLSLHGRNYLETRGDQSDRRSRRQIAAPGREEKHRSRDTARRSEQLRQEDGANVFRRVGMRRLRQGVHRAVAAARAARTG